MCVQVDYFFKANYRGGLPTRFDSFQEKPKAAAWIIQRRRRFYPLNWCELLTVGGVFVVKRLGLAN